MIKFTTGNVGIGTTNPVNKLQVIGDASITGPAYVGGTLTVSGALTTAALTANGSITANGKAETFKHVVAYETDSVTEKGYMDVVIVLSDRPLTPAQAHDPERLEAMARSEGLAALG